MTPALSLIYNLYKRHAYDDTYTKIFSLKYYFLQDIYTALRLLPFMQVFFCKYFTLQLFHSLNCTEYNSQENILM